MKKNWIQLFDKQLEEITDKPKLLLHACCAPCSSYVIETLEKYFNITILYYNPNIHPETEYVRRLNELKKFLNEFPLAQKVHLVEEEYNQRDYFDAVNTEKDIELQVEAERGERCRRCYEFRMKKAFEYAVKNNYDFFTTTLSISPYKDADKINIIGEQLSENIGNISGVASGGGSVASGGGSVASGGDDVASGDGSVASGDGSVASAGSGVASAGSGVASAGSGVASDNHINSTQYLYADFKKRNGFKRSLELSSQYSLYRQDYCGCIYSMKNRGTKGN